MVFLDKDNNIVAKACTRDSLYHLVTDHPTALTAAIADLNISTDIRPNSQPNSLGTPDTTANDINFDHPVWKWHC